VKWLYIAAAAFAVNHLWNVLDLYPQTRTYLFLKTLSYHAFTLSKTLVSLVAFYILSNIQFRLDDKNSIDFSNQVPLALFLSLFATFSVIESFSLKLGSLRIIDLSKVIEEFKARVADDARNKKDQQIKDTVQSVAEKLSRKLSVDDLRTEFFLVMDLPPEKRQAELEAIETQARAVRLSVERLLAQRIANVDMNRAQRLLREQTRNSGETVG
jgi:hypothetical protein